MKKKKLKLSLVLVLALALVSFTTISKKEVVVKESYVTWIGYKVTGKHEGTVNLKGGKLLFDGEKLIGGDFIMDMTSIDVTDLKGEWKDKLVGHLKSDDFFGSDNHPTATLKITNVKMEGDSYNVTSDLTIKGITNSVTFKMNVSENSATSNIKIDRTKFDIKYGSASFFDDLKDRAISNEFDLSVNLKF